MNRHPLLIQAFLILAISVLSACQPDSSTELAWQPPAFQTPTANGEDFAFPNHLERPTIILFWATWCPYCKALMPHLQSIMLEHPGKVDVLALNIRE